MSERITLRPGGLGKAIRDRRRDLGLTQEELGRKAGKTYQYIGKIERDEVEPSLETIRDVLEALRLTLKLEKKE